MAEQVRLTTPRLRVVREGEDDLELQAINADLVLWDKTRFRHKWPTATDAPFLWLTFTAWAAGRRTGAIPADLTYEQFEAQTLQVEALDDDEDDDDAPGGWSEYGRPTRLGPVPG